MNKPQTYDRWRRRVQVDEILRPFGMNVFHWIFLLQSPRWIDRTRTLADTIFYNISMEGSVPIKRVSWYWREFHLPDATLETFRTSDRDLFERGLVRYIDDEIATLMVIERSEFDPQPLKADELLDFRVLSHDGWELWRTVKECLSDGASPVLTGEIVNDREVHHSGVRFTSSQCCRECADGSGLRNDEGVVRDVGPWYSIFHGKLMPGGWRLICPHAARPAGFLKRTEV